MALSAIAGDRTRADAGPARRSSVASAISLVIVVPLVAGVALTVLLSVSIPSWLFREAAPGAARTLEPSTFTPTAHPVACDGERWPVKTLSDADASRVVFTPIRTTVRELLRLKRPDSLAQDLYRHRIAPVEWTTYVIRALAVELRLDGDNDTRLIIADPADLHRTMITEFVYWGCAGAIDSKQKDTFKSAFEQLHFLFGDKLSPTFARDGQAFVLADWFKPTHLDRRTGRVISGPRGDPPPPELIESATVEITGVGFFDNSDHDSEGAAPSGIQLHPVLSVRRVSDHGR